MVSVAALVLGPTHSAVSAEEIGGSPPQNTPRQLAPRQLAEPTGPLTREMAAELFAHAEKLIATREYATAIPLYRQIADQPTADAMLVRSCRFRLGESLYQSGELQLAESQLSAFVRDYPQCHLLAYALPHLGHIAFRNKDYPRALDLYQRALDFRPQGPLALECWYGKARSAEMLTDPDSACQIYQYIAGEFPGEDRQRALLRWGLLEYATREFSQAIPPLRALTSESPHGRFTPVGRFWLGMSYLHHGDYAQAAQALQQGLDAHPNHAMADEMAFFAAEALTRNRSYQDALDCYCMIEVQWPDSKWADDALVGRMQIHQRRHDTDAVHALAKKFHTQHANSERHADVDRLVDKVLSRHVPSDNQATTTKKKVASSDTSPAETADSPVTTTETTTVAITVQKPQTPAGVQSNSAVPDDAIVVIAKGKQLLAAGNVSEARARFVQVVRSPYAARSAAAAEAQRLIGKTYMIAGDPWRAIRESLAVPASFPQFPDECGAALTQAGRCYEHLGDARSAQGVYARAEIAFGQAVQQVARK